MSEGLWGVVPPMLAALLLSVAAEYGLMKPRPAFRSRPAWSWALHAGSVWLLFLLGLAVFQRPWFAACQPLAWHLLLLAVNRVKREALREPFVFQDFEYFSDLLSHPRLYLPFFGYLNAALGCLAAALFILAGLEFEPSLRDAEGSGRWLSALAWAGLITALVLWPGMRGLRRVRAEFDADKDVERFGLLACLWLYGLAERVTPVLPERFRGLCVPAGPEAAHVVVVQSESFFDARRVSGNIAPHVYAWLDEMKARAVEHGLLEVPAWGANTVRSEFAFLSGLRDEALGVHRFNPYRKLRQVDTVAHAFKRAGYRTICVHPYAAAFYQRARQFPLFGFDEFIDIRAFSSEDKVGAFVGDVALAKRVNALLGDSAGPLFVFVITMENHGPLHLETVTDEERACLHVVAPLPEQALLTPYLRHVVNAGEMQKLLCEGLASLPRDAWLCWYGDHLPIMPAVYAQAGFEDARTDYFIWRARHEAASPAGGPTGSAMADLAGRLIERMRNEGSGHG